MHALKPQAHTPGPVHTNWLAGGRLGWARGLGLAAWVLGSPPAGRSKSNINEFGHMAHVRPHGSRYGCSTCPPFAGAFSPLTLSSQLSRLGTPSMALVLFERRNPGIKSEKPCFSAVGAKNGPKLGQTLCSRGLLGLKMCAKTGKGRNLYLGIQGQGPPHATSLKSPGCS
jgi:hypothetical protein